VVKVAIGEEGAILDANPAELARARAHGGETARSKFVARFVRSIVQSWLGGDFAPSATASRLLAWRKSSMPS